MGAPDDIAVDQGIPLDAEALGRGGGDGLRRMAEGQLEFGQAKHG